MTLHYDSQSTLHIEANLVIHEKEKYIKVDCHFVKDEAQYGNVIISYVQSTNQLADILTKALGHQRFVNRNLKLVDKIFFQLSDICSIQFSQGNL
ncbi:Copia protein, partial [Mucuna pruriens]